MKSNENVEIMKEIMKKENMKMKNVSKGENNNNRRNENNNEIMNNINQWKKISK